MQSTHIPAGGRYPILRTIAILWLVGAIIALAYGVYQAIATLAGSTGLEAMPVTGGIGARVVGCCVWLAITFFAVIFNIAIAELIKLAMDVEQNTRMTAMNTSATASSMAPATAPMAASTSDGIRGRFAEESAEAALLRGH